MGHDLFKEQECPKAKKPQSLYFVTGGAGLSDCVKLHPRVILNNKKPAENFLDRRTMWQQGSIVKLIKLFSNHLALVMIFI